MSTPLEFRAEPPGLPVGLTARVPARIRALALVLAAGAFAVVLAGVQSRLFDIERHSVPKELALSATAFVALLLMAPGWRRIEAGVVDALLGAFVLWSAVSAVLAVNPWLAARGFGMSFAALVIFVAARTVAREWSASPVVAGLASAAVLGAGLGVAQAYGADWTWLAESRPPGATFGNRNFLAHLTTIAAPLLLLGTLRARRPWLSIAGLIGIGIAAAAIVLTRSRAAWLGLAVSVGAMTVAMFIGRRAISAALGRRRRRAALFALAIGVVGAIALPNRLRWRSDTPYADTLAALGDFSQGSGRGRLVQYRNTLGLGAMDPVFGVGPGNWFVHYPRVTTRNDPSVSVGDPIPTNPWPSSDWVTFLSERGAVAVLLLLGAGAAVVLTALRRLRSGDGAVALNAVAIIGVLSAAFITGLFDAVLLFPPPAYFVAAAAGALLPRTGSVLSRELRGWRRRAAIGLPLVLAAGLTLMSAGSVGAIVISANASRDAMRRAVVFEPGSYRLRLGLSRSGNCRARLPHARAANRLLPFHDAPRRALSACGERPPKR
jgi:hypothetical protein